MEAQKLHYENISGLLIRREGALSWRCPLCKTEGQSSEVMRCCPECGSEEATTPGAQPAPSFADAYQGAMEEVAIWKRRALEAEYLNRKFIAEINGPMHMGEPAQPAPSVPEDWKLVPTEVIDLYSFMCAAFVPMTPQQGQIALQLDLAKRAMLAVAPEAKP